MFCLLLVACSFSGLLLCFGGYGLLCRFAGCWLITTVVSFGCCFWWLRDCLVGV